MLRRFLPLLLLLLLSCTARPKLRVMVLGIDGCDPKLLQQFMDEGKLPHFSRLAQEGSFTTLATTTPPQSPVAWATFVTGLDPGAHGIFDFIHRDLKTMQPVASMTSVEDGRSVLKREGKPFWGHLRDRGIPTTLLKVAANFPPQGSPGRVLTGMGTPDLLGTYGTFTFYTTSDEPPPPELSGGQFVRVEVREGKMRASLIGPENSGLPFHLWVDGQDPSAVVQVEDQRILLAEGEWSEWVPVRFPPAAGMVRFYLKSVRPDLQLYVTPVNLDPCRPAQAITSPESFSRHLCRCCGRFYTQGMPEDTKALVHGVFTDAEFLVQNELVLKERRRLFRQGLKEFEEGLFFFYLSTPDILSHLYWNTVDPEHPGYREERASKFAGAIESSYLEADRLVGEALEAVDDRTVLLVISDHGFAPYHRSFNLNGWLRENGYLEGTRGAVNWSKTRAYGLGFNGLYLNLQGREPEGVVQAGEKEQLLQELSERLLGIEDQGRRVIRGVYRAEEVYTQTHLRDRSPDLVVGYERGYRAGWKTVLGDPEGPILEDNLEPWSGDHLIAPDVVPGVLLCNRKLKVEDAALVDIAPTVLKLFELSPPSEMRGKALLEP